MHIIDKSNDCEYYIINGIQNDYKTSKAVKLEKMVYLKYLID